MKILSISNCPLVASQGSGYVTLNFCQGLRDRHHQVDLFGPESYEPFQGIKQAKSYRQALGILGFTLQKLRQYQYDVVEFYGGESWLAAKVLKSWQQRNFLLVSHSNGLETRCLEMLAHYADRGEVEHPFKRWYQLDATQLFVDAFAQVDAIVTVSTDDRAYALNAGYQDGDHVLAIENSLPNAYLGLTVDFARPPVIGYCGSWIDRKGVKVIAQDMAQLLLDFPHCSFKLIGVGAEFRKESHFPSVVCPQIEVIPFVEDKKALQQIYQSLTILILPSLYESFGLVAAEAMACGCALVASRVGFAASLKPSEEAMILPEVTSPHLYDGVRSLLLNESLRLQVAQAGYQRVQSLRWSWAVEQLESAYLGWLKELRQRKQWF